MISESAVWAIFLLPLAASALIGLVVRPFLNRVAILAGLVSILAVAAAFALSVLTLASTLGQHGEAGYPSYLWLQAGDFELRIGILLDPLTAIMLVTVTAVSLAVQVYSLGYMAHDGGFARFYAFLSLFTASMLGLVMASNVLQMFVFWEGVGLCSFLLIGFWFNRPAAAAAAKKAFLVTRIGDLGFLLAILYLFSHRADFPAGADPLSITQLNEAVRAGLLASGVVTWLALGFFLGAIGKSAQFPLHIWLPDAMEGPTPVSALIHAATMVVAGVFLVARLFPLFESSDTAMTTVALIGAFTAFFAATMGLVAKDVKRVLAYSTISQIGYMIAALGIGAYTAGVFHLFTHAFFKALLFLGAGSVGHAAGTFNMDYLGGLRKHMPVTYWSFVVGALALAGVFPFAGFWSKDEILAHALHNGGTLDLVVLALLVAGAFMTAFYIFRAVFLTFHGEFRGGAPAEEAEAARHAPSAAAEGEPLAVGAGAHASTRGAPPASAHSAATPGGAHAVGHDTAASHGGVHLGESPATMWLVLALLAVPAAVIGFVVQPVGVGSLAGIPAHWLSGFLEGSASAPEEAEHVAFNLGLAGVALILAVLGILLATLMYGVRKLDPRRVTVRPVYTLLFNKYYMDDLAEGLISSRLYYRGLAQALRSFDQAVVDGVVDGVGWLGRNLGRGIAKVQSGEAQVYAVAFVLGSLGLVAALLIWK